MSSSDSEGRRGSGLPVDTASTPGARGMPTAALRRAFEELSNWGRWGDEDELGTLNLITPQRRRHAAGLVRFGESVLLGRQISPTYALDNPDPVLHHMLEAGAEASTGFHAMTDWFGMACHGFAVTHLDGLNHVSWDGVLYNGRPADSVSVRRGGRHGAVGLAGASIVGRGVLVDVPGLRGVPWLDPGEKIYPDDLSAWERRTEVRVGEGDVLLISTGRDARRRARGVWDFWTDGAAGLDASCLPWLHERGVAVLVSDCGQDAMPSGHPGIPTPVHAVGIVAIGLWLLDNALLDDLLETCLRLETWEFLFSCAPLDVKGSTGSPVAPVAVF